MKTHKTVQTHLIERWVINKTSKVKYMHTGISI